MSLRQLVLGTLFTGMGLFALNAMAADASQAASQSAATAPATHHAAKQHHARAAKVDLNTADQATLAKIRGIGEKKAAAIIDYRTKNGPYKSVADLKNLTNAKGRPLFTNKAIEGLANRLTVGPAA